MRLKIAYSKIKKRNLVLINNDTYQRETVSEQPIRQPLTFCTELKRQDKYEVLHLPDLINDVKFPSLLFLSPWLESNILTCNIIMYDY